MEGTTIITASMQTFKHESEFSEFIASLEDSNLRQNMHTGYTLQEQLQIVENCRASLEYLEIEAFNKPVETQALSTLFSFLKNLESQLPLSGSEQEYQMIHPLASWLFFLPLSFLRRAKSDPMVMVFLANFYGLLLALEPLFPAVDSAYFGALCLGPIEQIYRHVKFQQRHNSMDASLATYSNNRPLECLQFPMEQVMRYRNRHGWMQRPQEGFDMQFMRNVEAQIDFELVMSETSAQWSPYDETRNFDVFKQYHVDPHQQIPTSSPYQSVNYHPSYSTRQMLPKSPMDMEPSYVSLILP